MSSSRRSANLSPEIVSGSSLCWTSTHLSRCPDSSLNAQSVKLRRRNWCFPLQIGPPTCPTQSVGSSTTFFGTWVFRYQKQPSGRASTRWWGLAAPVTGTCLMTFGTSVTPSDSACEPVFAILPITCARHYKPAAWSSGTLALMANACKYLRRLRHRFAFTGEKIKFNAPPARKIPRCVKCSDPASGTAILAVLPPAGSSPAKIKFHDQRRIGKRVRFAPPAGRRCAELSLTLPVRKHS
jgi:hypothetical protein